VPDLSAQNFNDAVQREHFQIRGWMDGGGKKNVRFSTETGHISETVRDTAKITIRR